MLNLSVGGMLLRLKRALTPGSTYFVKLFLEGGEVAIVEAKVLRLLDADKTNGECKAAFKFTSVSLDDADSLRGFLLR